MMKFSTEGNSFQGSENGEELHIAIIVKEFPPHRIGGLETQAYRWARELHQRSDCQVTVYTKSYDKDVEYETGFLNPDFNVVRVPNLTVSPGRAISFKVLVFLFLLKDIEKYDILQCMQIQPYGFMGYLLKKLCGIPYFAWIRGGAYYYGLENTYSRFMIQTVINDARVLVQNEKVEQDVLSDFPTANLTVVNNGVNIPDSTADGDKVVYVGRLVEEKGVDKLINALEGLNQTLLVVGEGSDRGRLESLAKEKDVPVEFVGEVPPESVQEFLKQGKVFVLPSLHAEGSPNVILEAMAVGLPVVATNSGGTSGIIQNGETGYLVERGNKKELKMRIKELLSEDQTRIRMGANAREHVRQHHSWEQLAEELVGFYKDIVDKNQSPT